MEAGNREQIMRDSKARSADFLFEEMEAEDSKHAIQCNQAKTSTFVCDGCGAVFERSGDKRRAIERRLEKNAKALKFCSAECNNEYGRRPVCDKVTKSRVGELYKKLEESGFRCALSGVRLKKDTMSLDHVVPVSNGGSDDASNIQFVHRVVNQMKGTMSQEEFIEWCKRVAR